jgi:hypothetical protein
MPSIQRTIGLGVGELQDRPCADDRLRQVARHHDHHARAQRKAAMLALDRAGALEDEMDHDHVRGGATEPGALLDLAHGERVEPHVQGVQQLFQSCAGHANLTSLTKVEKLRLT